MHSKYQLTLHVLKKQDYSRVKKKQLYETKTTLHKLRHAFFLFHTANSWPLFRLPGEVSCFYLGQSHSTFTLLYLSCILFHFITLIRWNKVIIRFIFCSLNRHSATQTLGCITKLMSLGIAKHLLLMKKKTKRWISK